MNDMGVTHFPYDEVDRRLAGISDEDEATFSERHQELIRRHAERLAVHAIRELLRWQIHGDAPDLATNNYARSKRFCVERIGRRALSAAWVIDAGLLDGKSLRQIAKIPAARSKVHRLSAHAVEFKDKFGVYARGMKSEASRGHFSQASKGNKNAKKKTGAPFLACNCAEPSLN